MQDQPTVADLVAAARDYLTRELLPTVADQRLRFRGLVAANVLAIVERELRYGGAELLAEWESLANLLELAPANAEPRALREAVEAANRELCARIRQGDADLGPFRDAVFAHVRASVEAKLRINNPRYLQRLQAERAEA